jgi:glycine hydroxymethyltransferase
MIDNRPLEQVDPEMAALIRKDLERQNTHLHLIASENFASRAVMQATGSVFTNKYAEGYPTRRYYEGCEVIDEMEELANARVRHLFDAEHVNVQAHSGAQANMGVYFGLIEPGDTVMGMSLDQGGHLTHGSHVNFSGMYYDFVSYGLDPETELIDMDEVRRIALESRPEILLAGYSAYSRHLDYEAFRSIADEVGAIFMVDAAHFIGLIAGKAYPNPVPIADIVTGTTHKAFRGARGGLIMAKEQFGKAIDKGVFPGAQGGSLYNQIAGKAVAFHEAAQPEFRAYAAQVVANAKAMAQTFIDEGVRVVSGGTDNHLILADLRSVDADLTGKHAATMLDELGITMNRNSIPFDPRPPFVTSGIRMGTPAITTQGMEEADCRTAAQLISRAVHNYQDEAVLVDVKQEVAALASKFTPYESDFSGHV